MEVIEKSAEGLDRTVANTAPLAFAAIWMLGEWLRSDVPGFLDPR